MQKRRGGLKKMTARLIASLVVVAVLLCSASVLYAQCNASGMHRPIEDLFASEVVYPQERGETQIEVKRAIDTGEGEQTPPVVLMTEYGLSNAWQVGAGWDRSTRNVRLGSKLAFRCLHGAPYRLSIGADSEFEGTAGVHIEPNVILARDFSGRTYLFTSWSVDAPLTRHTEATNQWTFSGDIGMAVRVIRGVRLSTELPFSRRPSEPVELQVIPGLLWRWRDRVELGAGALMRASRNANRGGLMHVVWEVGGEHTPAPTSPRQARN
jgi:hypothetical protein